MVGKVYRRNPKKKNQLTYMPEIQQEKVDTSLWPATLVINRNQHALTFLKQDRKRMAKKGLNLPYYTYTIPEGQLGCLIKFLGKKLTLAALQSKIDNISQFLMRDLTSADGTRFDDETYIKLFESYTGHAEGIKVLETQRDDLMREFCAKPPATLEEALERGKKLAEIQNKIDEKRRRNAEGDEEDED